MRLQLNTSVNPLPRYLYCLDNDAKLVTPVKVLIIKEVAKSIWLLLATGIYYYYNFILIVLQYVSLWIASHW